MEVEYINGNMEGAAALNIKKERCYQYKSISVDSLKTDIWHFTLCLSQIIFCLYSSNIFNNQASYPDIEKYK